MMHFYYEGNYSYGPEPIKESAYFHGEKPKWQGSRSGGTRKQQKRTKIPKRKGVPRGRLKIR